MRWQDWLQTVEESYALLKSRCERVAVGGESTGAVLTCTWPRPTPKSRRCSPTRPRSSSRIAPDQVTTGYALAVVGYEFKPKPGPPSEADALWQGYDVRPDPGRAGVAAPAASRAAAAAAHPPAHPHRAGQARPHGGPERAPGNLRPGRLDRSKSCTGSTGRRTAWLSTANGNELFEITRRFLERVIYSFARG